MADTEVRTPSEHGGKPPGAPKGDEKRTKEQNEAEQKRLEECERQEQDRRNRAYPVYASGNNYDGTQPILTSGPFAYSGPGGPFQLPANLQWPRWVYHATEAPKQVRDQQELDCLEDGWSSDYIKRDYPKAKFGPNGEYTTVNDPEAEGKLEGNWSDKPPEKKEAKGQDPGNRTLQELGEAIRDSRRLSLDYGQINQALDSQADNVAMRPISGQDVPWPQYQASETPEQRKAREEAQDAQRKKKEAEDKKENGPKHR